MKRKFDAIVVGGGHAGIEAVFALAKTGKSVCLITLDLKNIAMMPCNPSIGGPAKGIITREIDSLGGMQGIFADQAMTQIKMLNFSKGPAVRALRAQIDKNKYSKIILNELRKTQNIFLVEDMVEDLIIKNNKVFGLITEKKLIFESKFIILTTGTYLNSYTFKGSEKKHSGPNNQRTTKSLSKNLKKIGIELQRLKTGTPPRIFTDSIDFSKVEEEKLDLNNFSFSNRSNKKILKQINSFITYTNNETHKIILNNINKSAMFSGSISGIGPRYCPSIEDKVVRFADKKRHQIFFEFETLKGDITYINGLSTSMPIKVQNKIIKTIPGLEKAKVAKYGYAIEYDAINPINLYPWLESKKIKGLYFAGQINGTSGYEEAAAQGLMAGINVSLAIDKKKPLILKRNEAYIGVLIDDLVTKGTNEPYRMLTSRAEYRLMLRNDNADKRLTKIGFKIGLVSKSIYENVIKKYQLIQEEIKKYKKIIIKPSSELGKKYNLKTGISYYELLKRPDVKITDLEKFKYLNELVTHLRLKGYIKKQEKEAKKMLRNEKIKLNKNFNYDIVPNISSEAKAKLNVIKPLTIGQALRIPGVNLADIQMLVFFLKYKNNK